MARRLTDTYWVEAEMIITIDHGYGVIEYDKKAVSKMIIIVPPETNDLLSFFLGEAIKATKSVKGLMSYRDVIIVNVNPL